MRSFLRLWKEKRNNHILIHRKLKHVLHRSCFIDTKSWKYVIEYIQRDVIENTKISNVTENRIYVWIKIRRYLSHVIKFHSSVKSILLHSIMDHLKSSHVISRLNYVSIKKTPPLVYCDFNLGFHIEVNRTIFKTKGARNHPPTVQK